MIEILIGINRLYQIKQIRKITDTSLTVIELDENDEFYPFKNWSDNRILSYCYKQTENSLSIYPYINTDLIDKFDRYAEIMESLALAGQIATKDLIRQDVLTEEQILKLVDVYSYYEVGKSYAVGDIFKHEGNLFEVIQAHTSQADWLPLTTKALYKCKTPSLVIPEWIQPTGGHDAYNVGDRVIFNGLMYEGLINNNVWSPVAYPQGWKLI